MAQHSRARTTLAASHGNYDGWPLTAVLVRYIWPFWLFRDASCGDLLSRAAAYRHNRDMRVYLPGYMLKWLITIGITLEVAQALDSLSSSASDAPDAFLVLATLAAMLTVVEICLLLITAAIYLYLNKHVSLH